MAFSVEEIELSDGQKGAVISEPHRSPESSILVAKLINDVEKSYDSGKKMLGES